MSTKTNQDSVTSVEAKPDFWALRKEMLEYKKSVLGISTRPSRPPFKASRRGPAPGYLRNALLDTLDWAYENDWFERLGENPDLMFFYSKTKQERWDAMTTPEKAHWLCGQLWNCTDILPGGVAQDFELTQNSYACLVRRLKPLISEPITST